MGGDPFTVGAEADVKAIMARITERIEDERRAGRYPPDVLADLDLETTGEQADPLDLAVTHLNQSAIFDTEVPAASRVPVVAPVAGAYKRAVRTSIRWYVRGILHQIQGFSGHAIRAFRIVADRLRNHDDRLTGVESGLSAASSDTAAALDEIRAELGRLREAVDENRSRSEGNRDLFDELEVRERLANVERAIRGLRRPAPTSPADAAGPSDERQRIDESIDYAGFEDRFRGSVEEIRERQRSYLSDFSDAPGRVVDLGCGRGEFLMNAKGSGLDAYGVDRHPDMVDRCVEAGLDVHRADVLHHLDGLEPGSLGGIFCAQVVEHLPLTDVPRLFERAATVLRPGGTLIVETINPESLIVFAAAFYVDLGHLRPLHPLTLRFLAERAGFAKVEIRYSSVPPVDVRPIPVGRTGRPETDEVLDVVDRNFDRIGSVMFGPQDFAVVATR